jgi:hypothetical protein
MLITVPVHTCIFCYLFPIKILFYLYLAFIKKILPNHLLSNHDSIVTSILMVHKASRLSIFDAHPMTANIIFCDT